MQCLRDLPKLIILDLAGAASLHHSFSIASRQHHFCRERPRLRQAHTVRAQGSKRDGCARCPHAACQVCVCVGRAAGNPLAGSLASAAAAAMATGGQAPAGGTVGSGGLAGSGPGSWTQAGSLAASTSAPSSSAPAEDYRLYVIYNVRKLKVRPSRSRCRTASRLSADRQSSQGLG